MKRKIIISTIALAMMSLTSFAQESAFGVKLGLNLANFSGDVTNNKSIASFHVGGMYNMMVSDQFAIQPELVLSGQGAKYEIDIPFFGKQSTSFNLLYLNIPVMAKYYVSESFNLLAGPQIGLLIGGDTQGVKGLDLGLGIGLGYELEGGFMFQGRYNLGLANISDGGGTLKNNVIQIGVGYFFN